MGSKAIGERSESAQTQDSPQRRRLDPLRLCRVLVALLMGLTAWVATGLLAEADLVALPAVLRYGVMLFLTFGLYQAWRGYVWTLTRRLPIAAESAEWQTALAWLPLLGVGLWVVPGLPSGRNSGTLLVAASLTIAATAQSAVVAYDRREALVAWLESHPLWTLAPGLTLALVLRLALFPVGHLTADEALYAYWARLVASGQDLLLRGVPVDKPPLFIYLLAGFFALLGSDEVVARLPNLLASLASIGILYAIAERLYTRRVAFLACLILALSPLDIAFGPAAFTDPLMVCLALLAWLLALTDHGTAAGFSLGLAVLTKPTGLLFAPLLLSPDLVRQGRIDRSAGHRLLWGAVGLSAALLPGVVWDLVLRADAPEVVGLGLAHYGGLPWTAPRDWAARLGVWRGHLTHIIGAELPNALLVIGLPLLLVWGRRNRRDALGHRTDRLLCLYALGYVLTHTVLGFQLWPRYLLGLAPVVALLLARVLSLAVELWPRARATVGRRWLYTALASAFLLATMGGPALTAARGEGLAAGDRWLYAGIDEVTGYVRAQVPPGSVIYHRELGWALSFYLFKAPYAFYYYGDETHLVLAARCIARSWPQRRHYVIYPAWATTDPIRQALAAADWTLTPIYQAYGDDGEPAMAVYRLDRPADPVHPVRGACPEIRLTTVR